MRNTAIVVALLSFVGMVDVATAEYKFDVHNNTKDKVIKLEASEDGKTWGEFDIGDGIAPGEKAQLVWDQSTDDEECKQKIRATYADKSKTAVSEFDFCEDDLTLELN
jgi:hypothetical protein